MFWATDSIYCCATVFVNAPFVPLPATTFPPCEMIGLFELATNPAIVFLATVELRMRTSRYPRSRIRPSRYCWPKSIRALPRKLPRRSQ